MHVRTFPEICSRMCATKHYVKNKIMKQCHLHVHILGLYFPCIGEMVNKCKTLWEGKTSIILWECEIFWFFKWQDRSQSIFFFNVRARLLKFRLPFIELTNQGFKTFSASCKKLRLGLCDSFVGKWRLCNC